MVSVEYDLRETRPPRATEVVYYPACEAFLQHAVDSFLVDPRLTSQFVCLSLVAQLRRKW
jgi:hypothetical protein